MALQANAQGQGAVLHGGQEQVAMGKVPFLGLEGEVDVAVFAHHILLGDLKDGLAGRDLIESQ